MPRKNKAFRKADDKVTGDENSADVTLSLLQQAKVSVMVEMGGYDRSGLLGALGRAPAKRTKNAAVTQRRKLPAIWTFIHVADRTEEAADVLMRLPTGGNSGYGSSMPAYVYDFEDLVGQGETYELDRLLKQRNRVRLPASPDAIARMNETLGWPGRYLVGKPAIARAVWVVASIAARKVPEKYIDDAIDEHYSKLTRSLGGMNYWTHEMEASPSRKTLYHMRMEGLRLITLGLTRDQVPVR